MRREKRREDFYSVHCRPLPRRLGASAVAFLFGFVLTISKSSADLHIVTTNHYRIQTDVESSLADDLARRMDGMYDEYSRRLVDFSPQEGNRLFDVYIFQHRGQYLNFTNNRAPNTGGVFMANKALAAFLEGQGRDQLRRTLQHEAFHQFAFSAIGPNLPVWLNEGLAQIFEEGIYDGRNFRIGEIPPRRVRQLQDDIAKRRLFEFRSFMGLSDKQWADNLVDRDRGAVEYNQAWAMAYYLIYAEESSGHPRFRSRLIDMLKLIHDGKEGPDAFVEAFSDNIPGFQQMFSEYARQMQPTALATSIENQDILADMMIELQAHGRRFNDIASFRNEIERYQMRITYTRGSLQWSSENNPGRYFHDAEGRDMTGDRLFFATRSGAPLPDLVSRPTDTLQLRTRFFEGKERPEHETVVEPPNR